MSLVIKDIKEMITNALNDYGKSLYSYFPGIYDESCELCESPRERNLSLYLAKILLEKNFLVYQEQPIEKGSRAKIDLIALNLLDNVILVVEAKRLHNTDEVEEITEDIRRMDKFNPDKRLFHISSKKLKRFNIAICQSIDRTIVAKWTKNDIKDRGKRWAALNKELKKADCVFSLAEPIYQDNECKKCGLCEPEDKYKLFGMAAIFSNDPVTLKK